MSVIKRTNVQPASQSQDEDTGKKNTTVNTNELDLTLNDRGGEISPFLSPSPFPSSFLTLPSLLPLLVSHLLPLSPLHPMSYSSPILSIPLPLSLPLSIPLLFKSSKGSG